MAIESVAPHMVASDMFPLKTISAKLAETGHPASVTTLRTWIKDRGIHTERIRRTDYASYSDILAVHRDMVAMRD
ncbi:hypothetical protein AB0D12_32040 [Streptomyces sp. NPDC048479]|uniref:hypothetical protein n=1 Tax=Streptomyces sp. NPDC048479 TaxID=3154725 RepID=UPI003430FE42